MSTAWRSSGIEMERFTFTLVSTTAAGGAEDTLRFSGSGKMKKTPDGWLLRYAGSDGQGNAVASSLKLWDDRRRAVIRNDSYHLTLDTEAEVPLCLPSPGGMLTLTAVTRRLHWRLDEADGEITLDYTLCQSGAAAADLRLTMALKEER